MSENISFGKKVFRLNTNNGIAKNDFDNKLNESQKKLLNSVFSKKFDVNQDGVLDSNELKNFEDALKKAASGKDSNNMGKLEARNFMQNELGLSGNDLESISRDDLFEILDIIQCDCDSIESAETKNGITKIKYNNNIPADDDGRQLISESYATDGTTIKPKSKDYAIENGWVEHELYDDNGELSFLSRTKGTVTETLDLNNDNRIIQRDIDKGSISVTIKFIYDDEAGTVTEQTYENGSEEPSSIVEKNLDDVNSDNDTGDDDSDDDNDDDDIKPDNEVEEKKPLIIDAVTNTENTGDESPRVEGIISKRKNNKS